MLAFYINLIDGGTPVQTRFNINRQLSFEIPRNSNGKPRNLVCVINEKHDNKKQIRRGIVSSSKIIH